MDKRERHFVLVHGACHGAWCWYKVATLLRLAGQRVTAIDLAASGVHPKRVEEVHSISDQTEPLMEFMEALPAEERVVLVGHSAGGISISLAMERFPANISVAVYVAAFMHGPDLNFLTVTKEYHINQGPNRWTDIRHTYDKGTDKPPTSLLFGPKFLSSRLYNLSTPEDLSLATLLVRPYPLYHDEEELSRETALTKENYGSVRRVYVVIEDDNVIKKDFQRWMIENNPTEEVMVISGSDHMVMLSKPQQLCSCLQGIAEKYN